MEGSARYPRMCRRGHVIVGPGDEREGRCRLCRAASKRRYEQSAKGRAVQLRYNGSVKGQDRVWKYEGSTKAILRRIRAELHAAYAARDALG